MAAFSLPDHLAKRLPPLMRVEFYDGRLYVSDVRDSRWGEHDCTFELRPTGNYGLDIRGGAYASCNFNIEALNGHNVRIFTFNRGRRLWTFAATSLDTKDWAFLRNEKAAQEMFGGPLSYLLWGAFAIPYIGLMIGGLALFIQAGTGRDGGTSAMLGVACWVTVFILYRFLLWHRKKNARLIYEIVRDLQGDQEKQVLKAQNSGRL